MFLPLSLAAIGPIPRKDMAAATGFYNLTRQLGGSIGVAILATLLSERTAFHRAVLAEKLAASDPHVVERVTALTAGFAARGMSPDVAHAQALALLDRTITGQAAIMSFGDTFWFTAGLVIVFLPLVFVLGRPPRGAAVDAH
jgi:DHA2 family multidrug resistance protein